MRYLKAKGVRKIALLTTTDTTGEDGENVALENLRSPEFRDLFFDPNPPRSMFQAVVTVLSGRWNARLRTRILNRLFFIFVAMQKRFSLARTRFRRDATAGYP